MATIKEKEAARKVLLKIGMSAEKVEKAIESLDDESEIEDSDLMTDKEARVRLDKDFKQKYEGSGKAMAWDFIDKNHAKYEALLSDEAKAKYVVLPNTQAKNEFLLEYLQSRGVQSGDSAAYKKSFTELQAKVASDYVEKSKYDEIVGKVSPAQRRAINAEISEFATRHPKISETLKSDRRFKNNLIADFEESIAKKGYVVDFETGQLKDKEGVSVVGDNNEILTAIGYIDNLIVEYPDWAKKSDGGSASATVIVEGGKSSTGLSNSQSKNLDRL